MTSPPLCSGVSFMPPRSVARAAPRHKDDNSPAGGGCSRCRRPACVFRPNSATDSVSIRPAIPIHSGHLFRWMAATASTSWRLPRAHADRPREWPRLPGPTLSATESCETGGGSAGKEAARAQDHGRAQVEGSGLLAAADRREPRLREKHGRRHALAGRGERAHVRRGPGARRGRA